jgi:hypothetical protein
MAFAAIVDASAMVALFGRELLGAASISYEALGAALDLVSERGNGFVLPKWVPTPGNRKFHRTMDEVEGAIYRVIAAGRKRGHLFVKGEVVKVVPEPEMVEALVEWAQIIADGGVEEALRRKDDGAAAEAEADRMALLDDKGDDANNADERIQIIRKLD